MGRSTSAKRIIKDPTLGFAAETMQFFCCRGMHADIIVLCVQLSLSQATGLWRHGIEIAAARVRNNMVISRERVVSDSATTIKSLSSTSGRLKEHILRRRIPPIWVNTHGQSVRAWWMRTEHWFNVRFSDAVSDWNQWLTSL